jgi:hypothetical protein
MGRIAEKGLDYFPLDTAWDTSVKLVKAKFGACRGAGFLTELWSSIYRENYYRIWNEETELLFADEIKEEVAWVHEVIEYLFDKELLDRAIFEAHGVITGRGIQKRYFKIARDTLKRTCLDYLPGITYPKFMPENIPPEKGDFLGGKADNLRGNPDRLHGNADKGKGKGRGKEGEGETEKKEEVLFSPKSLRKGGGGDARESENPPAALSEISPSEDDLFAFALARVKARKKQPGNPEAYARKIMHDEDVIAAFKALNAEKTQERPKASIPDPPSCDCEKQGKISEMIPGGGRCLACGALWEYDVQFGEWLKERAESSA